MNSFVGENTEQQARKSLYGFSKKLSYRVETQIATVADALDSTRNRLQTLDYTEANATIAAEGQILTLLSVVPDIYNVWFAFEPGTFYPDRYFTKSYLKQPDGIREVFDVTGDTLRDPAMSGWYHIPFNSGVDYYKTVNPIDYLTGDGTIYIVPITFPVIKDGRVIGCVGADINYENMLAYFRFMKDFEEQTIYLLSHDKLPIYTTADTLSSNMTFPLSYADIDHIIDTRSTLLLDVVDANNREISAIAAPISIERLENPLLLYMEVPKAALREPANELIRSLFAVLAATLLVVALAAFCIARSMSRQLRKMRRKAQGIASGNHNVIFDKHFSGGRCLEICALDRALQSMVRQLMEVHSLKLAAVTAEIEQEKLKAAALAKSRFFATMSHEIRTPMNAISGLSELLLNSSLDEKQLRYVKDIKLSSSSLLKLINDILDSAKMESGKFELMPRNYNLMLMLDNLCSVIDMMASNKGLEFSFSHMGEMPHCLFGDADRLRQILINILNNAIKYTKKGKVTLRLTNEGDTLFFEVSDSGIGMKPETLSIIFDPYSQVGGKDAAQIEGTGLGLTITKKLVELMEGTIGVASEYGKGSTFYVRIPLVPGDASELLESAQARTTAACEWKAHVLIVDDTHLNLVVAEGLLNMFGLTCDLATSGADALKQVQCTHYDLVFMDHLMPEMDGIETTMALRELGPEYTDLPIIALTANALEGVRETLLHAGMNDFLSKPIEVEHLRVLLEKWLSPKAGKGRADGPGVIASMHMYTSDGKAANA